VKFFKKRLILILFLLLLQSHCVVAQTKYSNVAINIYNSGVALHKQGKYSFAEQKYI